VEGERNGARDARSGSCHHRRHRPARLAKPRPAEAVTMAMRLPWLAVALLAGCAGPSDAADSAPALCEGGDAARERHGTDCLCCHTGEFTVAGSVETGSDVATVV